jgi:hypothetical protein
MEVEYATRKRQLLEECHVAPEIFSQVMPRLATFMAPFVRTGSSALDRGEAHL